MDRDFSGTVFQWRGPAPFCWLALPQDSCDYAAPRPPGRHTDGGVIPVLGCIGATQWETSLLPKNGGYVLPVKIAVRTLEQVDVGDSVMVAVSIGPPPRTPSQRCRSNLRITRWAVRTPVPQIEGLTATVATLRHCQDQDRAIVI